MKLSEQLKLMMDDTTDPTKKEVTRDMLLKAIRLEEFLKTCSDDFDCDHDAHVWGTFCRTCVADSVLYKNEEK